MVIVGANMGISRMTREHVGIATALGGCGGIESNE
jgi:GTPase